jgi:hypothetical protein
MIKNSYIENIPHYGTWAIVTKLLSKEAGSYIKSIFDLNTS